MRHLFLTLSLFFICFLSCKSINQKIVKQQLSLSQKEFKIIKKDKDIINGLYKLINDSIDTQKIKDPLKNYFINYNKKQLMVTVEMYSVYGNKVTIGKAELDSTNKSIPRINSLEELKAFKEKRDEEIEAAKKVFNEKYKKKDSL